SAEAKKAFKSAPTWEKSAKAINAFVEIYGKKPQQRGKETIEIEDSEFSEPSLANAYLRYKENPEFKDALSEKAKEVFETKLTWEKYATAINAFFLEYHENPKQHGDRTIKIEGSEFSEYQLAQAYQRNKKHLKFIAKLSKKAKKPFKSEPAWQKLAKAINAFVLEYEKKPKQGGDRTIEIEGYEFSEDRLAKAYYSHNENLKFMDALSAKAKEAFKATPAWTKHAKAINAFVETYGKKPKKNGERTIEIEGLKLSEAQLASSYQRYKGISKFTDVLSAEAKKAFKSAPTWEKSAKAINAFVLEYEKNPKLKQGGDRTIEIEGYEFLEQQLADAYLRYQENPEFRKKLSAKARGAFEPFGKKSAKAINAFVETYGEKPKYNGDRTIEIEGYKFSEQRLARAYPSYKNNYEFIKKLSAEAKKAFKSEPAWQKLAKAINAFVKRYGRKPQQRGKETIEIEGYEFSEDSLANAYVRYKENPEFRKKLSAKARWAYEPFGKRSVKAINAFVLQYNENPKHNGERSIEIEGYEFSEDSLANAYVRYKENPEFRKKLSAKARWAFEPFWKRSAKAINAFVLEYEKKPKQGGDRTIEIEGYKCLEDQLARAYQTHKEKSEFKDALSTEAKKLFRSWGKISCKALTQ
ncbi:hypothetical protein PN36_35040, partial [Candidatus Thiomargarita nelsonii]